MIVLGSEYVQYNPGLKGAYSRCRQYWKNPGAVAGLGLEPKHVGVDRFLAILSVIVQAAFSFQGMELVVMCVLLFLASHFVG